LKKKRRKKAKKQKSNSRKPGRAFVFDEKVESNEDIGYSRRVVVKQKL
jgi:hypothetical protein